MREKKENFLEDLLGKDITVFCRSGIKYGGILITVSFDYIQLKNNDDYSYVAREFIEAILHPIVED